MPNHVLNSIAASTISLKAKLTGIVLLGFALLLTISFFMLSRGIEKVTTEQLQDHELVVANLLAKEMTPAVRFKDSKRLDKIYENIAEDNDGLVHVRVLDAGGVELSGHGAAQESLQFGALITKALASGQVEAKVDGAMHAIAVPIHTEDAQALLGVAGFVWDGSHELAQQTSEIRSVFLVQFPIAFAAIVIIMFVISIIVVKPILRLSKAMVAVSKGQYALEIPFVARKDEIGTMARELQAFQSNLASNAEYQNARSQETELRRELLRTVGNNLADLARGRLDCKIDSTAFAALDADHLAICDDFNGVVDTLRDMLQSVFATAESVTNSSNELSAASEEQAKRSEVQASTLEESAAAIEDLNNSVQNTAQLASDANDKISENKRLAAKGGEVVDQTVKSMRDIAASSEQITAIIGVIDDIAFQTNLLALNAGVEAARAGETGRGFAVVASEVRALAQRASESANEIKSLILRSGEFVREGSDRANEAGAALKDIISGVNVLSETVSLIASTSRDQALNLSEIKENVSELDKVTQLNAAMIEESSASSRSLTDEAMKMMDALGTFALNTSKHFSPALPDGRTTGWEADTEKPERAKQATPRFETKRVAQGNAAVILAEDVSDVWDDF